MVLATALLYGPAMFFIKFFILMLYFRIFKEDNGKDLYAPSSKGYAEAIPQ